MGNEQISLGLIGNPLWLNRFLFNRLSLDGDRHFLFLGYTLMNRLGKKISYLDPDKGICCFDKNHKNKNGQDDG
ncbi:hypothetical protein [Lacrimispora sphenoides]|uniref:hypothetical protein n=1 Tax=Lacrimispora sphenoides TaxID=29370 RepID=UPI00140B3107|nr:hypothetical protein [Lacrimispora sphenoides]